jgi:hypothetical protein
MKTSATLKSGKRLWGIYHTDREYARELGSPLNGNRQKHGAHCGCNGNIMVNILATRCWRLENHFAARIGVARRRKIPVGYAQNPSCHFV